MPNRSQFPFFTHTAGTFPRPQIRPGNQEQAIQALIGRHQCLGLVLVAHAACIGSIGLGRARNRHQIFGRDRFHQCVDHCATKLATGTAHTYSHHHTP